MNSPHYTDGPVTIWHGDCLDVMRQLPDASVDAVVTDPPYGLEFMGREWDSFRSDDRDVRGYNGRATGAAGEARALTGDDVSEHPGRRNRAVAYGGGNRATTSRCEACGKRDQFRKPHGCAEGTNWRTEIVDPYAAPPSMLAFQNWTREWATEAYRLLKPGGHLLAFGGTRTFHRLTAGIEDAGFEIRDSIAWLYGSGFPKSLDVSKAIDKAAGVERQVVEQRRRASGSATYDKRPSRPAGLYATDEFDVTAPATADAARWNGWGTAMKPAHEPVVVARKPLQPRGTLATIGSHLDRLEAGCRHVANGAGPSSAPTRPASPAAKTATAPAHAATPHGDEAAPQTATGAEAGSFAPTGTSAFALTVERYWNTVTSWRASWVELCEATSTSTTSTTTRPTTDLETLSSCLSQITLAGTAQSTPALERWSSLVDVADALFAASVLSSRSIRTLTAIGSATEQAAPSGAAEYEPIVVARKPLTGTVAANVLAYGTGALNIDASRIEGRERTDYGLANATRSKGATYGTPTPSADFDSSKGRWPANVILDEHTAPLLDQQSGDRRSAGDYPSGASTAGLFGQRQQGQLYADAGGASRFFYTAKASTDERPSVDGIAHPTVKPVDLMRWLVKLVCPPGGTVLEPFAGSGTTVEACVLEGFRCIAIEREADYLPLILQRIRKPHAVGLDLDGWDDTPAPKPSKGRWPSNVILSESQADVLDEQSGERPGFSGGGATSGAVRNEVYGDGWKRNPDPAYYGDSGGASRFFKTVPDPEPVAFDFGEWEA